MWMCTARVDGQGRQTPGATRRIAVNIEPQPSLHIGRPAHPPEPRAQQQVCTDGVGSVEREVSLQLWHRVLAALYQRACRTRNSTCMAQHDPFDLLLLPTSGAQLTDQSTR